jgi:hypothetical protein
VNPDSGAAGLIGFPCKETSPAVTRVTAAIELVLPWSSMALRLIEFAAAEQLGVSRRVKSAISIPVLLTPSARMQGLSSTSMTATALVATVTLDRNIAASNAPCV